ncbi:MAG: valine--tRNA ligase [Candidatus Buchananbacteria bacterium RIFCSPHIGHO2_01_FULL_47_11b]|uniref:Valine--tRNA ligase n=1 Tax=Candidatus Buchananbacteria bacterium RIFCSPHIGHO2_01_FULL_47_11b TaxID=1797537 RepID=A0A1G1Y4X1_9BACT|nr:MAG: valine--tRNA ligase [Candidatus Buchananbacteria bacterium RIFCSPHIGHO2_01_FULL_47_11b]
MSNDFNRDIPKAYEPQKYEDSIYTTWEESGFFNPDNLPGSRKQPFTISMPPPNATGVLHIGHAVMLALEDIVIRFARMRGKKALWLPGTDHAAIATQSKVEGLLKKQTGKTKHDLGREAFLKEIEKFVEGSRGTIRSQIRKMGSSCDWSRERFTLDDGLTAAVTEAFIRMYTDGLIYRGDRIVNWDPQLQTTVSDDEVEYIERTDSFYYIKYGPFTIATSRPETKFGDKYVVMHPDDQRYAHYHDGQQIEVEWINGKITATVVKDEAIDMTLGTGVMTITPWHDSIDFDIAARHNLDREQIIDAEGKLLPIAGEFAGMDIADARPRIVKKLESKGLLEKIDANYVHNVATNSRGDGLIEPQIKRQWFINVNQSVKAFGGKTIKQRALEAVQTGEIEIIPQRFSKVYFHWLENLRDWCISRQIWYGHRIPAWYRVNFKSEISNLKSDEEIYVGATPPKDDGWQQDPDTLDTWFSSGLWTFSTLGWPEKTKDLKTFHPTNLMETGYDILFFWVARMIIMSTYLMGEIPFKHVYLHGLVRDEQGRKMSKSLENTIDPLDMIKQFGADATRLSLVIGTSPGNDTNLSETKIGGYRNFVNKLWNISRYILLNVKKSKLITAEPKPKTVADKWILTELNELIEFSTRNLEEYNFSIVGERIYEFTWSKLADWYIEVAKIEGGKDELLFYILQTLLKLWHPFTPFVTEVIWQQLGSTTPLMVAAWPTAGKTVDPKASSQFELLTAVVSAIRNIRSESKIPPAKRLPATIISKKHEKFFVEQQKVITALARLSDVTVAAAGKKPAGSLSAVVTGTEIYLPVSGTIDIAVEVKRLNSELKRIEEFIGHLEAKLKNERFLERAPKEIVTIEREKLEEHQIKLEKIKQQLASLR